MELVCVPARVFEDAELGEPLAEEVVVVDVTGAREWPRNLRAPLDLDVDRLIRRDGLRQRHDRHRLVCGVAVIGRDVARGESIEATAFPEAHSQNTYIGPPPRIGSRCVGVTTETPFAQPRGLGVAEGIPVEMKLQLTRRICADIAPVNALASVQRAVTRFERDVYVVAGVARRSRAGR